MTSRLHLLGLVAVLAIGAAGCSSGSKGGGAENFAGTWTYTGAINPNCLAAAPIDLTGQSTNITEIDSAHVSFALGSICTVRFFVDGTIATAEPGQSCMFEIPSVGLQTITITHWTLVLSGDNITSDFMGMVFGCTPTGTGTLTRVPEAGVAGG
jgi:hypothetical protein